jgi:hypothetical protein
MYAHGLNTCGCESLNSQRLQWAPKHKEFHTSYTSRAHVAPTKKNLAGLGNLFKAVMAKLRIPLTEKEQMDLLELDKKAQNKSDKKETHQAKKRQSELEKEKRKKSVAEKQRSQAIKRTYQVDPEYSKFNDHSIPTALQGLALSRNKKARNASHSISLPSPTTTASTTTDSTPSSPTALISLPSPIQSSPGRTTSSQTQSQPSQLQTDCPPSNSSDAALVQSLKGKRLMEMTRKYGLVLQYKKDNSSKGRKERLLQFLEDPAKHAHYLSSRKRKPLEPEPKLTKRRRKEPAQTPHQVGPTAVTATN